MSHGTVGVSPTMSKIAAQLEGKILDAGGKVKKATTGNRKKLQGSGFEKMEWETGSCSTYRPQPTRLSCLPLTRLPIARLLPGDVR
jgi:hypothetical protein